MGSHGTPASFAPPPPGREGSLLSAGVLQRMHALEEAAQREREQAVREQALREATLVNQVPQVAGPAQHQNRVPTQVVPPQEIQAPPQVTHQVHDTAAHAVEAFRAPGPGLEACKKVLREALLLSGGMDISHWDPCVVAQFRQPHPGGMGLCQQVSPLRRPRPQLCQVCQACEASGSGAATADFAGSGFQGEA